jgi:hypothetical protein
MLSKIEPRSVFPSILSPIHVRIDGGDGNDVNEMLLGADWGKIVFVQLRTSVPTSVAKNSKNGLVGVIFSAQENA